jgi:uncharacterized protein
VREGADSSDPTKRIDIVNTGFVAGDTFDVKWVNITDRDPASPSFSGGTSVAAQGVAAGASRFVRLEGLWRGSCTMYFHSTSGGAAGRGQVWGFNIAEQKLTLIFESPGTDVLDSPDNICVAPG